MVVATSDDGCRKENRLVGEVEGIDLLLVPWPRFRGSGIGRSTGWTVTGHTHNGVNG